MFFTNLRHFIKNYKNLNIIQVFKSPQNPKNKQNTQNEDIDRELGSLQRDNQNLLIETKEYGAKLQKELKLDCSNWNQNKL